MRVGAGRETIDLQESWHGLERAGFDCGVGFSWRFRWIRRECVRKAYASPYAYLGAKKNKSPYAYLGKKPTKHWW